MSYLGSWKIGDYVPIPAATHRFSSGAAFLPTSLTYSIYEDSDTGSPIDTNVDMVPAAPFAGIVGCYYIRRQLTALAGFDKGKNYVVIVKATVDGVSAIQMHTFQIEAEVDANTVSPVVAATLDAAETGTGLTAIGDARLANLDAAVSGAAVPGDAMTLDPAETGVGLTALGDVRIAALDAAVSSRAAAGDAMTLTAGERNSVADALLKRDWTGMTGEAARSVLNALRFLRNKWTVAANTLTVTKEDDATAAWTATVTTDATAEPVVGSDPA